MQIFFSKNIKVYAIFNDQSFNHMLSNDIISFEQLGPDIFLISPWKHNLCCGYPAEVPFYAEIRRNTMFIPPHIWSYGFGTTQQTVIWQVLYKRSTLVGYTCIYLSVLALTHWFFWQFQFYRSWQFCNCLQSGNWQLRSKRYQLAFDS